MEIILSPSSGDNTSQINAALAEVFNGGGGCVTLTNGLYRCYGNFDPITNGILTVPQVNLYQGTPRHIRLIGQSRGSFLGTNEDQYVGGVVLDFRNAPTPTSPPELFGPMPSAFSAAPYVVTSWTFNASVWNHCYVEMDNLYFLLPPGAPFSGVNLANSLQAKIGDNVRISTGLINNDFVDPGTTMASIGLYMPQIQNNVLSNVGSAVMAGFYIGLICADHTHLGRPYLAYNRRGLFIWDSVHIISGDLSCEHCWRMIEIGSNAVMTVDLRLQGELAAPGNWYSPDSGNAGIVDTGSDCKGKIDYAVWDVATSQYVNLPINGASNIQLNRLR